MEHHIKPLTASIKIPGIDAHTRSVSEALKHEAECISKCMDDVMRGIFQTNPTHSICRYADIMANEYKELKNNFLLPSRLETQSLLSNYATYSTSKVFEPGDILKKAIQNALDGMTTPWLNIHNQKQSLAGLIKIQEIGHVLQTNPNFGHRPAEILRRHLGDWRPPITWPTDIYTDPQTRLKFYVERGLDSALTEFPVNAFDQVASIAGIKVPLPTLTGEHFSDSYPSFDVTNTGQQLNDGAYTRIALFERHVRCFIHKNMSAVLGPDWVRHRVDTSMQEKWRNNRDKAIAYEDNELPLIFYADFGDYEQVIVKKDNWNEVFNSVFRRKTLVQESFQRIYPIRNCTMHSRPITSADLLYLYTETYRLMRAFGVTV